MITKTGKRSLWERDDNKNAIFLDAHFRTQGTFTEEKKTFQYIVKQSKKKKKLL